MDTVPPRARRPNVWLWTIAALAASSWAVIAVVLAEIAPTKYVPRIFSSYHIEHFAAFYMVTVLATAGLSGIRLSRIAGAISILATILLLIRIFTPSHRAPALEDWAADICGVAAAVLPVVIGRFREVARQTEIAP